MLVGSLAAILSGCLAMRWKTRLPRAASITVAQPAVAVAALASPAAVAALAAPAAAMALSDDALPVSSEPPSPAASDTAHGLSASDREADGGDAFVGGEEEDAAKAAGGGDRSGPSEPKRGRLCTRLPPLDRTPDTPLAADDTPPLDAAADRPATRPAAASTAAVRWVDVVVPPGAPFDARLITEVTVAAVGEHTRRAGMREGDVVVALEGAAVRDAAELASRLAPPPTDDPESHPPRRLVMRRREAVEPQL